MEQTIQVETGGDPEGRHVVVIGGSFAGLGAAYSLRELLPPRDRVTVVSQSGHFVFAPSLIWAAMGKSVFNSSFDLGSALASKDIEFVQGSVRTVCLNERTVTVGDREIHYDRLVVATGGRPDTSVIPGLAGEFREAGWVVGEDSAMEARNTIRALVEDPGPVVIGVAQGASYISSAYELALSLDAHLRSEGVRKQIPITFVTAEPYLGHLGFGQTAMREKMQKLFEAREIASLVNVHIERVGSNRVQIAGHEPLEAKAALIMPPFTGSVNIWKSAGLTDEKGLIPVTPHFRHVEHEDVFAAGVGAYFRDPVPPLGSVSAPHTGYLALRMGQAAGKWAAASLGCGNGAGRTLPRTLDVRVIDGTSAGMVLMSRGTSHLHHRAWKVPGFAGHLLKEAIERYLLWRLRTGRLNLP